MRVPKLASMLIGFRLASNQSLRELAPAKISSEQSERALEARNIKIERAKQSSSLLMLIKWDRPLNAAFIWPGRLGRDAQVGAEPVVALGAALARPKPP